MRRLDKWDMVQWFMDKHPEIPNCKEVAELIDCMHASGLNPIHGEGFRKGQCFGALAVLERMGMITRLERWMLVDAMYYMDGKPAFHAYAKLKEANEALSGRQLPDAEREPGE